MTTPNLLDYTQLDLVSETIFELNMQHAKSNCNRNDPSLIGNANLVYDKPNPSYHVLEYVHIQAQDDSCIKPNVKSQNKDYELAHYLKIDPNFDSNSIPLPNTANSIPLPNTTNSMPLIPDAANASNVNHMEDYVTNINQSTSYSYQNNPRHYARRKSSNHSSVSNIDNTYLEELSSYSSLQYTNTPVNEEPHNFMNSCTIKLESQHSEPPHLVKCKSVVSPQTHHWNVPSSIPEMVSRAVNLTIDAEFKILHQYKRNYHRKNYYPPKSRRRRNPNILKWKPLSIFKVYSNLTPKEIENTNYFDCIPRCSCFGQINMRIKGAWKRTSPATDSIIYTVEQRPFTLTPTLHGIR